MDKQLLTIHHITQIQSYSYYLMTVKLGQSFKKVFTYIRQTVYIQTSDFMVPVRNVVINSFNFKRWSNLCMMYCTCFEDNLRGPKLSK